jgi:DNA-binding NarL/FixJ family response regulator
MKTEYIEFCGKEITLHEAKIIALLCKGLDRYNASLELGNKPNTLDKQITTIFHKTGTTKNTELIALALANGFDTKGNFKGNPIL